MKPLAIDLYCGLGGWTEGLLAEGYRVVGFDIERHYYGDAKYPAQLVIQDVLTLHGSQFKDAALIVASPPCQEYSYMAMPWTRAKQLQQEYESGIRDRSTLTALFDACFRIQREASNTAGRHIPLVVENVRGAQKWVGSAGWHYGSFYLWGDIPALMPITHKGTKVPMAPGGDSLTIGFQQMAKLQGGHKNPGFRFDGSGKSFQSESVNRLDDGYKSSGMNWSDRTKRGQDFTRIAGRQSEGVKVAGNKLSENGFAIPIARQIDKTMKPESFQLNDEDRRLHLSYSRKAASAHIAKIPFVLAQHIARAWKPTI